MVNFGDIFSNCEDWSALDSAAVLSKTAASATNVLGQTFSLVTKNSGSTVLAIKEGSKWLIRFDRPHPGTLFSHLNVNSSLVPLRRDPHLWLPAGTLTAASSAGKAIEIMNQLPVATVVDCGIMAKAVYDDTQNGGVEKTVEATGKIAGGWVGSYTGSTVGSFVGGLIFAGPAAIVGGIAGSLAGAVAGTVYGPAMSKKVYEEGTALYNQAPSIKQMSEQAGSYWYSWK